MMHNPQAEPEARIQNAMRQLLAGPVPDGLKCDVKSLCTLAGVPRATLYRTYPHLKAEFDRQRQAAQEAGQQPDPRLAQIERLKAEVATLRERLSRKNTEARRSEGVPGHSPVPPRSPARRDHHASTTA
ncbi:hypothetical protein Strvi_2602 [Streptomyces violaceusniger Tu 4113]|uniref:Uncharacterized protein n=1 Tax=Streptomyces violaceusniger (strain Tu 4113) TaxID=653045 RepID=G2PDL8_STRV4|nr:hypothetical protein Strvi_2602 [Streptomyces violaceusniger Tu 4113]